ncbi:MAG: maleylacetoacetate isomerase [Hyphomicrobiales bacterium]|nr:maleylacetoacetate isomerase [Hyphomicrobiales bacterium]
MGLRLYSRYQNSAGQRVRIVLNLKGIAYDYVPVSSLDREAWARINPQGLMPALEIGDRVVAQSLAIIELLEDLHPDPPVLPADPVLRAQVRAFAGLIAADLHPLNNNRVRRFLETDLAVPPDGVRRWYRHWVATALHSLEAMVADRVPPTRFAFTDAPTLAEACLVPQMDNARRFDCDLAPYPRLRAIDAACRGLDAFRRAAPENQPDFPSRPARDA